MLANLHSCARSCACALALSLVIVGCDSDNGSSGVPDDRLEVSNITTGQDGTATVEVAGIEIRITTPTPEGDPVPNVGVQAAVTQSYVIVLTSDPSGAHYPGIRIVRAGDDAINVTVDQREVGLLLDPFAAAPQFIEDIRREEGLTEECVTGTLNVILAGIEAALEGNDVGIVFHLTEDAAETLGYDDTRTAAVLEAFLSASPALAVALMGEVFGIFNADTQTVCWGANDQGVPVTPFYWTELQLDRDFALRVTLTWGEDPDDLDSHLFTPDIQGQSHHIYYLNEGSLTSPPFAELDVDDITSFGPENVTVDQLFPGTYRYAVYHYGGAGTITTSGANVSVFNSDGLQHELTVPQQTSGENWWWHVFDVDGATGNITIVNTISANPPVASTGKAGSDSFRTPKRAD